MLFPWKCSCWCTVSKTKAIFVGLPVLFMCTVSIRLTSVLLDFYSSLSYFDAVMFWGQWRPS